MLRARLAGVDPKRAARRLDELVEVVELERSELDVKPGLVSAGQRQRAALLAALVHEPRLLVLDEPFSAVHPELAEQVLAHLVDWSGASGGSVVMATHDVELVERMDISVMQGELEREGRVARSLFRIRQ